MLSYEELSQVEKVVFDRVSPVALKEAEVKVFRDLGSTLYCQIGHTITLLDKNVAEVLKGQGVNFVETAK